MSNQMEQIIKLALERPQIIDQLPMEAFGDIEGRILLGLKRQAQLIDKPTLRSVLDELALNTAELEGIRPLIQGIKAAPKMDEAQFQLALFKLRTKAQMNIARTMATLDPKDGAKDIQALALRMAQLNEIKADQYRQPINAKQWELLERAEMEEVRLNIDCFDDNDVTIKKKVLYGFIATTNGGKTIIKTWMATKLIRVGQNILYLALEEPAEDTIRRVHQACLGLTETQYVERTRDGFKAIGEEFKAKSDEKGWGEFIVVEWPNIEVKEMKRRLLEYEREHEIKIDGVVVDYGKLITVPTKAGQEWERIGLVFKELKTFCMELNVYCITSIQLNREATKNFLKDGQTPDIYDVAGAYEATNHLNYIWAVQLSYAPEEGLDYDNPNTELGQFTLTVQKQKYGKLRKGSRMLFGWTADHNLTQKTITTELPETLESILSV